MLNRIKIVWTHAVLSSRKGVQRRKIQFHSRVGPIVACNPPQSLVYVHIRGSLTICKCQIGGNATSNGSLFAAMYTTEQWMNSTYKHLFLVLFVLTSDTLMLPCLCYTFVTDIPIYFRKPILWLNIFFSISLCSHFYSQWGFQRSPKRSSKCV